MAAALLMDIVDNCVQIRCSFCRVWDEGAFGGQLDGHSHAVSV